MQMIRVMQMNAIRYATENFHRHVTRPEKCPHCDALSTLLALGYYTRSVTSLERGILCIFIKRFRCRICGGTVSVLPSFVQPYRLIANATIGEFFNGTISANSLSWLPLLKQYWNQFTEWLSEINRIVKSLIERSPPNLDSAGWWQALDEAFGGIEKITLMLVGQFGVTLFGRYRCHSPNRDIKTN